MFCSPWPWVLASTASRPFIPTFFSINLIASFLEIPSSLDYFSFAFLIKVPTKTIKNSLKKFLNNFSEDRKMMRNLAGFFFCLSFKIADIFIKGHLKYWKIKKMKLSDNLEMFMDTLLRATILKISQVFYSYFFFI